MGTAYASIYAAEYDAAAGGYWVDHTYDLSTIGLDLSEPRLSMFGLCQDLSDP